MEDFSAAEFRRFLEMLDSYFYCIPVNEFLKGLPSKDKKFPLVWMSE